MNEKSTRSRRTRLTRPYPTHTLEGALGVPEAIQNVNSGLPFDREHLAGALGTTPSSSAFTMRLNASANYGLTQGGYADKTISRTPLPAASLAPPPALSLSTVSSSSRIVASTSSPST